MHRIRISGFKVKFTAPLKRLLGHLSAPLLGEPLVALVRLEGGGEEGIALGIHGRQVTETFIS